MIDPILNARLDALEDNLRHMRDMELLREDSPSWAALELGQFHPGTAAFVREALNKVIYSQAEEQLEAVLKIRQLLALPGQASGEKGKQHLVDAWTQYVQVQEQCGAFFGECLELIGGLTFRSMSLEALEDRIYRVADALVSECVNMTVSGLERRTPTVPVLPETLVRTVARVTGLLFPQWTIWMLPFIGHELGHVLTGHAEETFIRPMRSFITEQVANEPDEVAKKKAENYIREYVADAFATYNIGPAYACAVLLLGLNPLDPHKDTDASPAHAKRAYLVLKMLERMNEVPDPDKPYTIVTKKLTQQWHGMVGRVGQNPGPEEKDQLALDDLIDGIWKCLNQMRPTARYCHDEEERGWLVAKRWYNTWKNQLGKEMLEISESDISESNWLRDVLNAAWLCRLDHPDDKETAEPIAEAAYNLSQIVLKKYREQRDTAPSSRNMPPHEVGMAQRASRRRV